MKQLMTTQVITGMYIMALLLSTSLRAAPSGEANNPFNQFTDPSGGVSLFTGTILFQALTPVIRLSTRVSKGNYPDLLLKFKEVNCKRESS